MRAAGLSVRLGIDIDPDAAETFRSNFSEADFLCKDIREVSVRDLTNFIARDDGLPVVFGACAPCQPFSKQNKQSGTADARRNLLPEFHRFVEEYRPEYIFIENVPGMQTVKGIPGPFEDFLSFLSKLGYFYDFKVVLAYNYGVPQRRKRLVLIASKLGTIKVPEPITGPGALDSSLPTVRQWIAGLATLPAGGVDPNDAIHRAAALSSLNIQRISSTPVGSGRESWPRSLRLACHENYAGHTDVYGRMHWDKPASALTTRCISLSNGRFGHPDQNRAVSVREAACIQTFPRDFKFFGNLNSMARQVGNAVPVKMAEVFGMEFKRHYEQYLTSRGA